MFCYNCGQQLPEDARFCMQCGTAVISATPSQMGENIAKKDYAIYART